MATAQSVAAESGIEEVRANLLPEDKFRIIKALQNEGCTVAMIGDGINDAPALVQADVGIAMGVAGTQAALEAADVALMNDDIGKVAEARVLAARAYRTIKQNLIVGSRCCPPSWNHRSDSPLHRTRRGGNASSRAGCPSVLEFGQAAAREAGSMIDRTASLQLGHKLSVNIRKNRKLSGVSLPWEAHDASANFIAMRRFRTLLIPEVDFTRLIDWAKTFERARCQTVSP